MVKIYSGLIFLCLLFLVSPMFAQTHVPSWADALKEKKVTLPVYWFTSVPYIYLDNQGELRGLEYEMVVDFKNFLKQKYDVDINLHWLMTKSFSNTIDIIKNMEKGGALGISAFSITPDRQQVVGFSPPYMADISVLISHDALPVATTLEEFDRIFDNSKAISIKGTTYEVDLKKIKEDRNLHFDIQYIPSEANVLKTVQNEKNAFGYIDLPVYLVTLKQNAALSVKRQNLFTLHRQGYSFIYPLNSDWKIPLEEYFHSETFQNKKNNIIERYIDPELFHFIENLSVKSEGELDLLLKEREIQHEDLQGKVNLLLKEKVIVNFLIGVIVVVVVFLFLIYYLYVQKNKFNNLLVSKNMMIETQGTALAIQKEELKNRNKKLENLNEEKNNLMRILAHDLRSPVNQIIGLTQLLKMEEQIGTSGELIDKMLVGAERIKNLIDKILNERNESEYQDDLKIKPIVLHALFNNLKSGFEETLNKKALTLSINVEENLTIHTDETYLIQILDNLVSNAIKFSERGKKILLSAERKDQHTEIFVEDEGPGFSEEDKILLFKKFQPLSAQPTAGEKSLGIGLSIVKRFVEILKGTVQCISQTGAGAKFKLTLPDLNKD